MTQLDFDKTRRLRLAKETLRALERPSGEALGDRSLVDFSCPIICSRTCPPPV